MKYKVTYKKYNRPLFIFNCGSTQDARATLIGNTVFKKDTGTLFCESEFVRAIQTPDSIIVLDELSRGHHDCWNIIMSAIDPTQRTLRLDESQSSEVIKVADGVTFIATANIGNEYTATRVMDKALMFRFPVRIEMKLLDLYEEFRLLTVLYPDATKKQKDMFHELCKISNDTKVQAKMEEQKITTFIPTGTVVEMAEMVMDGFDLIEIVKMVIYPLYDEESGVDSERLYARQIVQKYLGADSSDPSPIKIPSTS